MSSTPIRLAIVDDHTLFREALAQMLSLEDDIVVSAQAADPFEAVAIVRRDAPDVLLLDVDMPGPGVTPTVQSLRAAAPRMHIVMLSMYDDPQTIRSLLSLGVRGYLLKTASQAELLAGIRKIMRDPRQIVLSVTPRLFEPAVERDDFVLSEREREVLSLAAQALSNAQIARALGLRETTVKRHMHNVFVKLGAVSRIDAVNKARAAGHLGADEGGHAR